jgi:hypothetical protein
MARNWKEDYQYDRKSDWLISAGRTGRLVSHLGVPPIAPDVPIPPVVTKGGGDKPITAHIQTECEPPLTREEAINANGFARGRR